MSDCCAIATFYKQCFSSYVIYLLVFNKLSWCNVSNTTYPEYRVGASETVTKKMFYLHLICSTVVTIKFCWHLQFMNQHSILKAMI